MGTRNKHQAQVTEIDVDRFNQLHQMVKFLGKTKKYVVRADSYLEGMCNHYHLFQVGGPNVPVATIINEFNKHFTMLEY